MLSQTLKELGVVGAGGAGFPADVKAASQVELVLANGAECEPLIHKDVEIMEHFAAEIVSGIQLMMEATGARRGIFGLKEKNARAVEAVRGQLGKRPIGLVLLGDFYPSGDEFELVYAATGKLIPPAGLPLQVGCVVNNVETLLNVHRAHQSRPVTEKYLTLAGAVRQPKTVRVPVGTTFRDCLALAGGATVADFGILVGGILMGTLSFDLDDVVTKTTAGLIVLPREHYVIERKARPPASMNRIGKSACDQCMYCTEFCPRYLLGYELMPHKVMRSLGFTLTGADNWNRWGVLCCACGLCTLYACPEDLYPKEACDQAKADLRQAGIKFVQQSPPRVHPLKEARRTPLAALRRRLKLQDYEHPAPLEATRFEPARVRIRLQQHAGKPARAVVQVNEKVSGGAVVGRVGADELGANVHASIDGTVTAVTDAYVEVTR